MLGVPKSDRAKGPRLHLQGRLAAMKAEQVPKRDSPKITPSVDPSASNVAASKLSRAQALLRKAVKKGLVLHGTQAYKDTALGHSCEEEPNNLHCMLKAHAKRKVAGPNAAQVAKQRALARVKSRSRRRRGIHYQHYIYHQQQQQQQQQQSGGEEKDMAEEKHFDFPKAAPLEGVMEPKRTHPVAMPMVEAIGITIVATLLVAGGGTFYFQTRKEQRRNQLQAMSSSSMSGFADRDI
jgi:hypothetical protein